MTIIRPTADNQTGLWTPSTGSTLYETVDEVSVSDTDYISTEGSGGENSVIKLLPLISMGNFGSTLINTRMINILYVPTINPLINLVPKFGGPNLRWWDTYQTIKPHISNNRTILYKNMTSVDDLYTFNMNEASTKYCTILMSVICINNTHENNSMAFGFIDADNRLSAHLTW